MSNVMVLPSLSELINLMESLKKPTTLLGWQNCSATKNAIISKFFFRNIPSMVMSHISKCINIEKQEQ